MVVPDIGGALGPRLPEPSSSRPSSPPTVAPGPPPAGEGPSELRGHGGRRRREGGWRRNPEDDDDEEEAPAPARCDDLVQKRLSMESGYSASEKHLEDEPVAVEMREPPHQRPELPSEQLSLPSSQADGKVANRDSGIDSISSPSHSEELCFASVEDGGVAYPCSPALLPRSSPSYARGGGEGEERAPEGARGGRDYSED